MALAVLLWVINGVAWNSPAEANTWRVIHLPAVRQSAAVCSPIPGLVYGALTPDSPPTDRPAAQHADLNLMLRGYAQTNAYLGLIDVGGTADPLAPQLWGLFGDQRLPEFRAAYQVYDWNWACNCRNPLITDPPVTLLGVATRPNEIIYLPRSGYHIGSGYEVLILYATRDQLTIKYTREDNVIEGYTIHLSGLCVAPQLLTLYRTLNAQGRQMLPALRPGQALGRASGAECKVAIRDYGRFLDPRSRKDWWRGK